MGARNRFGVAGLITSLLFAFACSDGGDTTGAGGSSSTTSNGSGGTSTSATGTGGATTNATGTGGAGTGGAGTGGTGGAGTGGAGGGSNLASLLTPQLFEQLFLHRGDSPCKGSFYTYQAFLAAASSFPAFASEGTDEIRKRELAAFLANISHETTGGWPTAPDGPYSWGLCWITEGGTVDPSQLPDYCSPSAQWPCASGKKYFGRGPIQLSWNYNYGQCGDALGLDLLNNPDQVAMDAEVAFRTALWFWMTPQAPKPSCHDVMSGQWTPSAADTAAGRLPGFGLTINIINGGIECGYPSPMQVLDRLGYYDRYTQVLGTTKGDNLDCASMQAY